ncbi:MAG: undecaprenyl-diphosphate phosphatase [Candidatus Omnitrophica bacterium]|nr:undecaprenyl-diphosphate phosphatase [Candidatus Omnitrophota bacterium]
MFKYIFLGIVQGVTEFFPVSSSAHLVILQKLLGMSGNEVALSVVLHLGTILALILYFFKDILKLLGDIKSLILIIIVTVITGAIGITGKNFFEGLFSSPKLVAFALIFTGIILILTKKFMDAKSEVLDIKKVGRMSSFRFSFLVSIPAVLGAAILEVKKIELLTKVDVKNFTWGFIFSFIAGIFSLWLLKRIIDKAKLYYFGYYCIFVALIALLFIK